MMKNTEWIVVLMGLIAVAACSPQQIRTAVSALNGDVSSTPDIMATKAAIEDSEHQTITAAARTPWWLAATLPPSATIGPTETPDFAGFRHQDAGSGVIVWDTITVKGYPIGVINQWYQLPKSLRVLAGGINSEQGAVAVLAPGIEISSPEIYYTPRQAGPVEISDAAGERLVLHSVSSGATFYFDVPARQFVDTLTVTIDAPTVTPRPTFTPIPTPLPVASPTIGFPPTQYPPVIPSGESYPALATGAMPTP